MKNVGSDLKAKPCLTEIYSHLERQIDRFGVTVFLRIGFVFLHCCLQHITYNGFLLEEESSPSKQYKAEGSFRDSS